MKLNYFHYHVARRREPMVHVNCDLRIFISRFAALQDRDFKASFEYLDGEHVFLFWVAENIFLLVATKSYEIIKTINAEQAGYADLYDRLQTDERLGFASYIYFEDCFYGIAATVHGPRNSVFTWMISEMLRRFGVEDYEFQNGPFETQSTRAEALTLPIIGRNIIEVGPESSLYAQFMGFLGLGNTHIVDSLEVIIKPGGSKNIRDVARTISEHVGDEGLRKYVVRAKQTLKDHLVDYYITGTGVLSDQIDARDEPKIIEKIKKKVSENKELAAKVAERRADPQYVTREIPTLTKLDQLPDWTGVVRIA